MNEKEHKGRHWCDGSCATSSTTMSRVHDPKNRNCEATKGHQCKIKECPTCTCPPTIEHEENTTIDPIVGNKATELAMEVWSYIFALKNSAKKTLRDDNNKEDTNK